MTENWQRFVSPAFVAVQVTVVVPAEKALPEGGTQMTTGAGSPIVTGAGQETFTVVAMLGALVRIFAGHVTVTAGSKPVPER